MSKQNVSMASITLVGAKQHLSAAKFYVKDIKDAALQEKMSAAIKSVEAVDTYIKERLADNS